MNELFAKIYLDECISPILADILSKEGWEAISAFKARMLGKSDPEQLLEAIKRKSVLVTSDKSTFLKEVKGSRHFGIIVISRNVDTSNISLICKRISNLLNTYTADEFEDAVIFASAVT